MMRSKGVYARKIDGEVVLGRKDNPDPENPPKPERRNSWYFANKQDFVCKQVWDIGQVYYNRMQDPKGRPGHHIKNPVHLVKLLYWLFLTTASQQEPFKTPYPTLEIVNKDGGTYVMITRVNERHWKDHANGIHDIITSTIPILDEYEKLMWEFCTDGGLTTKAEDIFRYDLWKSTKNNKITRLFKTNFRTNLKDQTGKVHKNAGIAPHILRHMRFYNLLVNHNIPPNLARQWGGLNNDNAFYVYEHIRTMLALGNQLDTLKAQNLLTNLKINSGIMLLQQKPNYQ